MIPIELFAPYEKQGQNVGSISAISRVRSLILRFLRLVMEPRQNVAQYFMFSKWKSKFGSAFLSSSWESKIALFFLTFPYPEPVPKNCVIFIGCNFESRASQVGLHKQKKDTASAKKGKVRLQRREGRRLKAVL